MDSGQVSSNSFQHYISFMESEFGGLGCSFHALLSRYLEMKKMYPELASKLQDLELLEGDSLSPVQHEGLLEKVKQFDRLRIKVQEEVHVLAQHPWFGIMHPDHKQEEFEPLLRSLRFVFIQLSKLWVEIQSIPLFLNSFEKNSLMEVEKILAWILQAPHWMERLSQSRMIPLAVSCDAKKKLLDFIRDIKSMRLLCTKVESVLGPKWIDFSSLEVALETLKKASALVEKNKWMQVPFLELKTAIFDFQKKNDFLAKWEHFFKALEEQFHFPYPVSLNHGKKALLILKHIAKIPKKIMLFKHERFLNPQYENVLREVLEKVNVLVEERKKLEISFRVEDPVHPDELKKLAAELSATGALRTLSASYQAAIHRYKTLLKVDHYLESRKKKRETAQEMAARLLKWASFLERKISFQNEPEMKALFGSLFKGIDTPFPLIFEACEWSACVYSDLSSLSSLKDEAFKASLLQVVFQESESKLSQLISFCLKEGVFKVDELGASFDAFLPSSSAFSESDPLFSCLREQVQSRLLDYSMLDKVRLELGLSDEISLEVLPECTAMVDELIFLKKRMDSDDALKEILKLSYQGMDSDIGAIEQVLSYVHFIESADLGAPLRKLFFSKYGPQRMHEARSLVGVAWSSFETFKELLQKIEIATYGQMKGALFSAVPDLLNRIQEALRHPGLMRSWVDYLKSEREIRSSGLSCLMDYYEKESLLEWPFELIYQFSFTESLLRLKIDKERQPMAFLEKPQEAFPPL